MTDQIPPGWCATEYTREDGSKVRLTWRGKWRPISAKGQWFEPYPSPAAAIAALEVERG